MLTQDLKNALFTRGQLKLNKYLISIRHMTDFVSNSSTTLELVLDLVNDFELLKDVSKLDRFEGDEFINHRIILLKDPVVDFTRMSIVTNMIHQTIVLEFLVAENKNKRENENA